MLQIRTRALLLLIAIFIWGRTEAQLSGSYTVPGSYPDLSSAIVDLNTQGISGAVTINIQAGYSETTTAGGFSLTVSGTVLNTITFQKIGIGANPLITAYSGGVGTPASAVQDGIWRLIGCDYITIDGIDLFDPNSSNPSTMEYGFGLFKASTSNGCQNNTIKNCAITLNLINNATGSGPSVDGSRGINVANCLPTFQTSNITPLSGAGSNSNNGFYSNTISNCNIGLALIGYIAPSPFTLADTGNDIGGLLSANGNTITNFGGSPGATNPAAAIRTLAQYGLNVSQNYINNNNGAGSNHPTTLRGIFVNTAVSANSSINNNTITVNGGGTTSQVSAIENVSGATPLNNTITIQNNSILNCGNALNTSGNFMGIYNNAASCTYLVVTGNLFNNINTRASTGSCYLIYNTGAVAAAITITNNIFSACSNSATSSGSYYSIYNSVATTANIQLCNNTFTSCSAAAATGVTQLINNSGATSGSVQMDANLVNACTYSFSSSGVFYGIYNASASCSTLSINSNTISNHVSSSNSGATHLLYNSGTLTNTMVTVSIQNNLLSDITSTSSSNGAFYSIWNSGVTTTLTSITGNTLNNINWQTTASLRYGISNSAVGSTSISISNNLISNCTASLNASGSFFGIFNNNTTAQSSGMLSLSTNTISNFNSRSGTGDVNCIISSGAITNTFSSISMNLNLINSCVSSITGSGAFYGIYNNGASSQSLSITGNTLSANSFTHATGTIYLVHNKGIAGSLFSAVTMSNNLISSISHSATSTGPFYGMFNNGVATTTLGVLSILNNTFTNGISITGTSPITIISNSAPVATLISMNGNLISQWSNTTTTTGAFSGIQNSGASAGGNLSISSNTLSNLSSNASSGLRSLVYNTASVANSINIQNNLISNTTHTASTSGAYYPIYNNNLSSAVSLVISGNGFNSNSAVMQSGAIYFIYNSAIASQTITNVSIFNNSILSYTGSSTSGNFCGIFNTGASVGSLSIGTNTLNNIQLLGLTNSKYIIYNSSPILSDLVFASNSITNITAGLNTTGAIYPIYNSGAIGGNLSISNNTLSTLQLTGTSGSLYMIHNLGAITNSLSYLNNVITGNTLSLASSGSGYQLSNTGNVTGNISMSNNTITLMQISVATGTAFAIYNGGNLSNGLRVDGNSLSDLTYSTGVTGSFFGIRNTASGLGTGTLSVNSNTFSNFQIAVNTSSTCMISNTGTLTGKLNMNSNVFVNSVVSSSTGPVYVACNEGSAAVGIDLNANSIVNYSVVSLGSGSVSLVTNNGPSAAISISSNTATAYTINGSSTSPVLFSNTGNASASVNMNGNMIAGGLLFTPNAVNITGMMNSGISLGYLKMSGNTFTTNSTSAGSATVCLISNTAFVSDSVVIKNNAFSLSCSNNTLSFSGTIYPLVNSGGSATGTLSIENNDFSNFLLSGPAGSGDIFFVANTNNNAECRINNNRWIGLSLNHTAAEYLIYNPSSTQNLLSVSGNSIVNGYNRTGVAGSMNLYLSGISSLGNGTQVISANNFSGITATLQGNGTFCGICSYDGSSLKTISNNVLSNINYNGSGFMSGYVVDNLGNATSIASSTVSGNILSGINWSGPLYGLKLNSAISPLFAAAIFSNSVVSVTTSAGPIGSYGAYLNGLGAGLNFYGNKVADLTDPSISAILQGIYVNTSSSYNITNNLVGSISSPSSDSPNGVIGISVAGTGTVNVNYNSIYLNAISTATVFGSSALYVSSSSALCLRNNILVNTSSSSGAGRTVVFWRSSGALGTYSLNSNNNIFYAGVPSFSRLLFYDGSSSYSTMPGFQGFANPRETVSFSENTPFQSTSGSNSNFLHVNPTLPTAANNGANNVPGILIDCDAQVRQGNPGYLGTGSAPDIGADEYDQVLTPCASASAGTISSASSTVLCAGETVFLYANGYSTTGNVVHQWKAAGNFAGPYVNVIGGSGANATSYSSGTLAAGNYYYVLVTTCTLGPFSSTSSPVHIFVNALPSASITVPSQTMCASVNFSLSGSSDIGTGYLWMGPGNFTSTNQNPVIPSIAPTGSGIYSLNVSTANCSSIGTISISVNAVPPPFLLSTSTSSICLGSSLTVSASVPLNSPTLTLGSQTYQNLNSTYPAPYSAYYGGQKMQVMVLAGELSSAGFIAGSPINSIQFPVVSMGSNWGTSIQNCQNFKIAMGSSTLSALNTFQSGLSTVFSSASFTPGIGYGNTHSFPNSYIWDGTSNLVIETLFSNGIYGTQGDAVIQYHSPTGFQSTLVYRADNQNVSFISAATTSNVAIGFVRPDLKLNGISVGTYSWGPATGLSSTSGSIVAAGPTLNTIYTASLSNGTCSSTKSVALYVMQIPTITISSNASTVCVGNSATLIAGGAANYTWSSGNTTSSVAVFPSMTSTYIVSGSNAACPVSSNSITIFSAPAFTFNTLATPTAICSGDSGTLSASGAQQYAWSNGSNSASVVITPTTTSALSVTGSDGSGCWSSKQVSIKVNNLPLIKVTPSADTACVGEKIEFGASGGTSYTWMPGSINATSLVTTANTSLQYTVTGSNLNNCMNTTTANLRVNGCTHLLEESLSDERFTVFPNPSNGDMRFNFEAEGTKRLRVFNLYGMLIKEFTTTETTETIELKGAAMGLYTVELSSGSISLVRKIVVE